MLREGLSGGHKGVTALADDSDVQESFRSRIRRIQPTPTQVDRLQKRAARIRNRLKACFPIVKCPLAGSYSRRTAIGGSSDLDLFALVRRRELAHGDGEIEATTFLRRVRDDLRACFPSTWVVVDRQAVVLDFANGDRIEVVPAVFDAPRPDGYPTYLIPDTGTGWIRTSPELHKRYLDQAAKRSGNKLPRLVQLLKYWALGRVSSLPIQSFYLEMSLAEAGVAVGAKSYGQAMADALDVLLKREVRAIKDPCGISDRIRAVQTRAQRESLVQAIATVSRQAERALEAEEGGDSCEARHRWRRVFNE